MAFYDKLNKTLQMIDDYQLEYPVVLDRNGDVTEQYNFQFVPSTFFIDENGVIRNMVQGIMAKEVVLSEIERTRQN